MSENTGSNQVSEHNINPSQQQSKQNSKKVISKVTENKEIIGEKVESQANINPQQDNETIPRHDDNLEHKLQLNENEIIKNQENLQYKLSNSVSFNMAFLEVKKNKEMKNNETIFKNTGFCIEGINSEITAGIKQASVKFNKDIHKTISELITKNDESLRPSDKIQESIKQLKLDNFKDHTVNIGHKIKALDENIRLIEDNDTITRIDQSMQGSQVQDNIRKSRVREIKNKKKILENKLDTLENAIHLLINEETDKKKLNVKNYLDNFERDKKEIEIKSKEFERKREERLKLLKGAQYRSEMKHREKLEQIDEEKQVKESKKREDYEATLKRMRQKSIDFLEEKQIQRDKWKTNETILEGRTYIHHKYEKLFNQKEKEFENIKNLKEEQEYMKKKSLLKPLRHEDFDEFQRKYEETRKEILYKKEKERIFKHEELKFSNKLIPRSNASVYFKIVEEEKNLKDSIEKQKSDKIFTCIKKKNFSKIIHENLAPKVDVDKRSELADRIAKLGQKTIPKKLRYDNSKRILMVKHDSSKPNKYKWKLNLSSLNDFTSANSSNSKINIRPGSHISSKLEKSMHKTRGDKRAMSHDDSLFINNEIKDLRDSTIDKRIPMTKNPDYLTETRLKKSVEFSSNPNSIKKIGSKKWENMIMNNKFSLPGNLESVKIQAKLIEDQAKMKGKYLRLNGGDEKNPQLGMDISNLYIDCIKAKLSILDKINATHK